MQVYGIEFAKVLSYGLNKASLTLEERIARYENQFTHYSTRKISAFQGRPIAWTYKK